MDPLTRRDLALALAGSGMASAQTSAPGEGDLLEAAREQIRKNSQQYAATPVAREVEPAFVFRP